MGLHAGWAQPWVTRRLRPFLLLQTEAQAAAGYGNRWGWKIRLDLLRRVVRGWAPRGDGRERPDQAIRGSGEELWGQHQGKRWQRVIRHESMD